ncbi:MAG: hypothetical protein NVV73_12320 [Cellvibrionaceae bacterium]|nr:hypothetical protein [Cellvibrionaceae bacterium]
MRTNGARGVRTANGTALPATDDTAAIYLPAGARGPASWSFSTFSVILNIANAAYVVRWRWARLLAGRTGDAGRRSVKRSAARRALAMRNERIAFQQHLASGWASILARRTASWAAAPATLLLR